jgi:hypothetical protein
VDDVVLAVEEGPLAVSPRRQQDRGEAEQQRVVRLNAGEQARFGWSRRPAPFEDVVAAQAVLGTGGQASVGGRWPLKGVFGAQLFYDAVVVH